MQWDCGKTPIPISVYLTGISPHPPSSKNAVGMKQFKSQVPLFKITILSQKTPLSHACTYSPTGHPVLSQAQSGILPISHWSPCVFTGIHLHSHWAPCAFTGMYPHTNP